MRLILGMILGALLLIAGAYYHDSMHTSTVAAGPDATQGITSDGELGRGRNELEQPQNSSLGRLRRPARTHQPRLIAVTTPDRSRLPMTIELAFFRHALERLFGILDPILVLVAIQRKQLDDLVSAAGGGPDPLGPRR